MTLHIPNIDISPGLDSPQVIDQISSACEQWGFFQITGHGIDVNLRLEFFDAMDKFFKLPMKSKQLLQRNENNFWGYYNKELTKNKIDKKEIYDIDANLDTLSNNSADFPVPWPVEYPELKNIVTQWMEQVEPLSLGILTAISSSLGQAPAALNRFFVKKHSSFLRFNYYPTDSEANDAMSELGIHPHTDAGALTVLAQDAVPGLQVEKNGNWHTVIPEDNSFIINIGDMLQVWSNDRFVASNHRVLGSSEQARYSAPYFYNPAYDTVCSPLLSNGDTAHYKPIPWQEFRSGRAAGDYADQGEEIQISRYRV